ncbi:MAG: PqqD family protein [Candidatus Schekmanbacteria bacterium]|nr:PqqD family protein [Candidatus Schekmanbacteria bacterium]
MSRRHSPPAISRDSLVCHSPGIDSAPIDDELVMISQRADAYYGLDPIGRHIWELLRAPIRVRDLCELLKQRYDVSAARCESDVLEFLDELYRVGLIGADAVD